MPWLERAGDRQRASKTFQDSTDSSKRRFIATGLPLHFESNLDSGVYDTPIDFSPRLVDRADLHGYYLSDADYRYALQTQVADQQQREIGTYSFAGRKGAHVIASRLERFGWVHWPTMDYAGFGPGGTHVAPTYAPANLSKSAREITVEGVEQAIGFNGAWTGIWTAGGKTIDLELSATGDGFRFDVRVPEDTRDWIKNNRAPSTPLNETYLCFAWEIDWADIPKIYQGATQKQPDDDYEAELDTVTLRDASDKFLAAMPQSWLIVGKGGPGKQIRLKKRFLKWGAKHYLVIGVRADVLNGLPAGDLLFDPTWGATDIGANADDGTAHYDGGPFHAWYTNGAYANMNLLGKYGNISDDVGLRWDNITIAQGSTVTDARIKITPAYYYGNSQTVSFDVALDNADDPGAFGSSDRPGQMTQTTNSPVAWSAGSWSTDVEETSPDLSTMVADRITAANWNSGDAMRFGLLDAGTSSRRKGFYDYNHGSAIVPTLTIDYTSGGTGVAVSMPGVSSSSALGALIAKGGAVTAIAGTAATGASGALGATGGAAYSLGGVFGAGSAGIVTAKGGAAMILPSASATSAAGTFVAKGGAVLTLTGVDASGAPGSLGAIGGASLILGGTVATTAAGTFTATGGASLTLPGVQADGFAGTITVSVAGGVSVALSGVSATAGIGTLSATGGAVVSLSGLQAAGAAGDITISIGTLVVTLQGVQATGEIGALSIQTGAGVTLQGVQSQGQAGVFSFGIAGGRIVATVFIEPAISAGASLEPAIKGRTKLN